MSERKSYTFRSTEPMSRAIDNIMDERDIDRTSVIKLALYLLAVHMQRSEIRAQSLTELVRDIEAQAPEGFPDLFTFCEGR